MLSRFYDTLPQFVRTRNTLLTCLLVCVVATIFSGITRNVTAVKYDLLMTAVFVVALAILMRLRYKRWHSPIAGKIAGLRAVTTGNARDLTSGKMAMEVALALARRPNTQLFVLVYPPADPDVEYVFEVSPQTFEHLIRERPVHYDPLDDPTRNWSA